MRRGATDYIPKPFTPAQVLLAVRKVEEVRTLEQSVSALREDLEGTTPEVRFSSDSPAMQRAMEIARQAAPTDAAVLLRGESGTGKTVLARAIHGWSRRSGKPFAVVSCPSLPTELLTSELFGHVKGAFTGAIRDNPGRIAACEGGTLFLDEIGDLPITLQPKLLRFLQDQEYERLGDPTTRKADVRVITATNRDLEEEVRTGRFREDLFYRLNVIQIEIPPLRDRPQDFEALATQLLAFYGRIHHRSFAGFTEDAMQAMKHHAWPGNLRELRNVIERASILCRSDRIGVEYLPGAFSRAKANPAVGNMVSLETIEEAHIRGVLASTGSLQEAAGVLGIDQATLWRRRKQYGI
ncbi:MAG: two component, sigma54 specific, transcriptional regulator, Fis family [Deltaproteobacteria bacterium]|jgi:NtrC-family two-component system response regulator AlgB|nr:two component, sigma54 specific, transcriptional regulator, Fis family [Deltaproteobacteria bacterium]MBP2688463.1 two component, sigma54 specific, transcriptional regulator, Fis family [Deltaproteobacteria bacterium]